MAGDTALLKELNEAPKPTPDIIFYYNAFYDLDSERAHGMSLARIPRSKILAYAEECGLGENESYEFIGIIQQADAAHLKELSKKFEK